MFLKSLFLSYFTLISFTSLINGFTTDLIHRDSLHSPTHDNSLTPNQRLINSLTRSIHRAKLLHNKLSKSEPEPDLVGYGGEYLVKFSVGTPPVPTIAIADTGSDVVWTQCKPCIQCFNQTLPFFSPSNSTSYRRVPCNTKVCHSLHESTHCSPTRKNCLYSSVYGDGSCTNGILATDKFTFKSAAGKDVVIPSLLFGCGFSNTGLFSGVESGIFGLGGGKSSFVSQSGFLTKGKFSYCLVPYNLLDENKKPYASSKLHFGNEAEVSGSNVVSTPLTFKKDQETFYFITMEGITVGNERFPFHAPSQNHSEESEGNLIIDSGTTLTTIPNFLYQKIEKAIKESIKLPQFQDPTGVMDLCYSTKEDIKDLPDIIIHLKGGDLKWKYENAFVRMDENSVCLTVKASDDISIYGNLAQVNFLIGYDHRKKVLSFKPADCRRS